MQGLPASLSDARLRLLVLTALAALFVLAGGRVLDRAGAGIPDWPGVAPAETSAAALPALPPLALLDPSDRLALAPLDARAANEAVPVRAEERGRAAPFVFAGPADALARARDCLALAAWYEAGDDPAGERAVVQVVLNRVRHPSYPNGVCAVVFQGSERQTGCQFTFTCDGALARVPSPAALARARAVAGAALAGQVDPEVGLATHYHADYVVPRWRDSLVKVAQQGAHIFYRFPGYWGTVVRPPQAISSDEPAIARIAALSPAHAARIEAEPSVASSVLADTTVTLAPLVAAVRERPAVAPEAEARNTLDMQVDPVARSGSFALRALAMCGASARCLVRGWLAPGVSSGTEGGRATARVTSAGDARVLAFVYVRDERTREGAYWDCGVFQRADTAQCLPTGARLDRILAST